MSGFLIQLRDKGFDRMAYFKLRSFDLTELKVSKVYDIGLQRYVAKNKFLYTKIYVYINSKIM